MSELTTIIRNMEAAGEPRERIASVVRNYNEKQKVAQADFADDREAEVKEEPSQTDATVEGGDTASSG